MNMFFVMKKKKSDELELVTAPLNRGDILPGANLSVHMLTFDPSNELYPQVSQETVFSLLPAHLANIPSLRDGCQ